MIAKMLMVAKYVGALAAIFAFSDAVNSAAIASVTTIANTLLLIWLHLRAGRVSKLLEERRITDAYLPLRNTQGRLVGYVDAAGSTDRPPGARRADDPPLDPLP